ncbi:hypothetical protein [Streptomyces dangxiongensis]|uniref:hypothetical protein n=1 Tax=Streptomyces dangxiongensis TaxID=1442032 RepID=UPI0013CEB497|nr:hypothetical protein [Streptomyces dangxiongensis]
MPDTTVPAVGRSPRGSRARPPGPSLPGTVPVAVGGDAGLSARAAGVAVRGAAAERNKRKGISVFRPISSASVIGGAVRPRPDTV